MAKTSSRAGHSGPRQSTHGVAWGWQSSSFGINTSMYTCRHIHIVLIAALNHMSKPFYTMCLLEYYCLNSELSRRSTGTYFSAVTYRLPSGNCTVHLPLDARDDGSSASASAALLEEPWRTPPNLSLSLYIYNNNNDDNDNNNNTTIV